MPWGACAPCASSRSPASSCSSAADPLTWSALEARGEIRGGRFVAMASERRAVRAARCGGAPAPRVRKLGEARRAPCSSAPPDPLTWIGHLLLRVGGLSVLTDPHFSDVLRRCSSPGAAGAAGAGPRVRIYAVLNRPSCSGRSSDCGQPGAALEVRRDPSPTTASSSRAQARRCFGPEVPVHRRHRLSPDFADIGARFGGFDLAAIPIGAYAPDHARQSRRPCRSTRTCARVLHWGTFENDRASRAARASRAKGRRRRSHTR